MADWEWFIAGIAVLLAVLLGAIGCISMPPPCQKNENCFWSQRVVMTGWGFAAVYEPPSLIFGYMSWSRNAPEFKEPPPNVPK